MKKLKVKKIVWKDSVKNGCIAGYVPGIETDFFNIMVINGRFALMHHLQNGSNLIDSETYYLLYDKLIEAQNAANRILRKYIHSFLEGV